MSIPGDRQRRNWCKANYIHHKAMLAIQTTGMVKKAALGCVTLVCHRFLALCQ